MCNSPSYSSSTPDARNFEVPTEGVVEYRGHHEVFPSQMQQFYHPECHNKARYYYPTVLSLNHIHIYKCFSTRINIMKIAVLPAPRGVY
jgi:hypothetical protein